MDKSRQRHSQPEIIDIGEIKTPVRKVIEGVLTIALWAAWVYFILPFITLLAWIFGIQLFISETFVKGGFAELIYMLKSGGVIICSVVLVVLGWVYYNYRWFLKRGERRNRFEKIVLEEDLADYFKVDLKRLRQFKKDPNITISFEDDQMVLQSASRSLLEEKTDASALRFCCPVCQSGLRIPASKVPNKGAWGKCPKCLERIFVTNYDALHTSEPGEGGPAYSEAIRALSKTG